MAFKSKPCLIILIIVVCIAAGLCLSGIQGGSNKQEVIESEGYKIWRALEQ